MSTLIVYSMTFGPTLVPRFLSSHCAPSSNLCECGGFSCSLCGFSTPHILLLWLLIPPFQWIHASPVAIKLPNVQKPSLQKSRNWRYCLLAAYHGPGAACTGLVCSVRNFSCFVAPCQPVLGQSPFESLPKYFCCDGLSVSSTRLLSPTLLVLPIVSTSVHWNFFTRIHVVKCFTNCSKIFSWETVLQNENTHTHTHARARACVCVCVCVCMCVEGAHITDHRITEQSVANPTKLKQQHSEIVLHDWTNVRRVHHREGRAVSYIFLALLYGRYVWSCVGSRIAQLV